MCIGLSNASATGPTYLQPLGTVLYPLPPIIPHGAAWTHIIEIATPCLQPGLIEGLKLMMENADSSVANGTEIIRRELEKLYKNKSHDAFSTSINSTLDLIWDNMAKATRISTKFLNEADELIIDGYNLWGAVKSPVCRKVGVSHFNEFQGDKKRRRRDIHAKFEADSKTSVSIRADTLATYNSHVPVTPDPPTKTTTTRKPYPSVNRQAPRIPSNVSPFTSGSVNPSDELTLDTQRDIKGHQHNTAMNHYMSRLGVKNELSSMMSDIPHTDQTDTPYAVRAYECVFVRNERRKCILLSEKPISGDQVIDYLLSRQKRSLLPFIGDIHSKLFGTATEHDLDIIDEAIKKLSQGVQSTKQFVSDTNKRMISISTETNKKVDLLMSRMRSSVDILQTDLVHFDTSTKALQAVVSKNEIKLFILSLSQQMGAHTTALLTSLLMARSNLLELIHQYRLISQSVRTKVIGSDLLDPSTINRVIEDASQFIDPLYEIAVDTSMASWYKSEIVKVDVISGKFVILMQIPIVPLQSSSSAMLIRSVPFSSHGKSVIFPYDQHVVLSKNKTEAWAIIPHSIYVECLGNPFSICTSPITMRKSTSPECLSSIIKDPTVIPGHCHLLLSEGSSFMEPQALQLNSDKWLLSLPKGDVMGSIACTDSAGIQYVSAYTLTDQMVIEVPPSCVLTGGGLYVEHRSSQHIPELKNTVVNKTNFTVPPPLTRNITILRSQNYLSALPQYKMSRALNWDDTLFIESSQRVDKIIAAAKSADVQYITKIDKITDEVHKIISQRASEKISWSSFFSLSGFHVSNLVSLGLSITACGLALYLFLRSRQLPMAPLIPLTKVPGAWSTPVPHKMINTSIPTPFNLTSSVTHIEYMQQQTHILQALMWIFMGCLMVFCMISTHKAMSRIVGHKLSLALTRMGIYPRNKKVTHNLGENQLVGFFLIKCRGWPSRYDTVVEMGLQICTLPLGLQEWYLSQPLSINDWLQDIGQTYSSKNLVVPLNWSPSSVCVRSRQIVGLETCHEMPKQLIIATQDIREQGGLPWWFMVTSMKITGVTRMMIMNHGQYNDLYTYA